MAAGNASSAGPLEDPAGAAGNAAQSGIDAAGKAVNGTIKGLVTAGEMAAGGIATAAEMAGSFVTDLLPFSIDAIVILA